MRTALGILGYSLAFLRLFDRKFYRSMPNLPLFSPLLFLTSSYQSAYYMPPSPFSYLSVHSSVPAIRGTIMQTGMTLAIQPIP